MAAILRASVSRAIVGLIPLVSKPWFYKRGCQETFFSLRRKREWLPRCPAPLAITVRLGPGAAFVPLQRFHA
jgi:hypothetical protein